MLTRAGLVRVRREGRRRLYSVNRAALGPVGRMLERMWDDALSRLAIRAELDAARRGPQPRRRRPASIRSQEHRRS